MLSPLLHGVGLAVALRPGCALMYNGGMAAGRMKMTLVQVILWCHDVLWGYQILWVWDARCVCVSAYVVRM